MFHPTYDCHRVTRPLHITGMLDDRLWAQAPAAPLTDPLTGEPKRYQTTARLLYDDTYLYLGFTCEDHYVWGTFTEHDAPIFIQECVEAFICPSGKMRQYYEINVSPLNTVFDALIFNSTPEGGERRVVTYPYTCEGLITRTHVDGELGVPGARGWSAEYAIPFLSLIGGDHLVPEPGDTWLLNLYRIDSEKENDLDLYAWGTIGKLDFHFPWAFGTLRFT